MMLSDETFYQEIQPEWRQAVKRIARGEPDRTDLMRAACLATGVVSVRQIISAVANTGGMTFLDILGNSVRGEIGRARTLVICLATELRPDLSNQQIADHLKRERSIVYVARKRAETLKAADNDFMHWYFRARKWLGLAV